MLLQLIILLYQINFFLACHYSCDTCTGPTNTDCSNCTVQSYRLFNSSDNTCKCPRLYFEISNKQVCASCHFSCLTCNGSDYMQCLLCDSTNSFRIFVTGECRCKDGYFSQFGIQKCSKCHYTCKTCSQIDDCTSCDDVSHHRFLHLSQCKCQDHFFSVTNNPICQNCHYTCNTCQGGGGINNCEDCSASSNRMLTHTNECICLAGYFENIVNINLSTCQKCSPQCRECSVSTTNCTSCQTEQHQLLINGSCGCQKNYFLDLIVDGACRLCHYSCESCQHYNNLCSSCPLNSNRIAIPDIENHCPCLSGFSDCMQQAFCSPCHHSCLNCSDYSSSECTKCGNVMIRNRQDFSSLNKSCPCLDGYYDDGQNSNCIPCENFCATCVNRAFECLTCPNSSMRNNLVDSNSYCVCLPGYFDIGEIACKQCNPNCLTCQGNEKKCTSCNAYKTLDLNQSKCLCKEEQFEDQTNNYICTKCDPNCLTCSERSTRCLSCRSEQFLSLSNNVCICDKLQFRMEDENKRCVCIKDYHEDLASKICQPKSLTFIVSVQKQQYSNSPLVTLLFSQNLVISGSEFFDNLNVTIDCLQPEQYSFIYEQLSAREFIINIKSSVNVPIKVGLKMKFKNFYRVQSQEGWFLSSQYEDLAVQSQLFPFIGEPSCISLCQAAQQMHSSYGFRVIITIINLVFPISIMVNGFSALQILVLSNAVIPANFYCMMRLLAPFAGISFYIPDWQEILPSFYNQTFLGIWLPDFQEGSWLLEQNERLRQLGFSTSFLNTCELQTLVYMAIYLLIEYYKFKYTILEKPRRSQTTLMRLYVLQSYFLKLVETNLMVIIIALILDIFSGNFNNFYRVFSFTTALVVAAIMANFFIRMILSFRKVEDRRCYPLIIYEQLLMDLRKDSISLPFSIGGTKMLKHIRCFHLYTLIKKLCFCLILITANEPKLQLSLLIVVQGLFLLILIFLQPYKYPCLNIMKGLVDLVFLLILILQITYTCQIHDEFIYKGQYFSFDQGQVTDMLNYGQYMLVLLFLHLVMCIGINVFWLKEYNKKEMLLIQRLPNIILETEEESSGVTTTTNLFHNDVELSNTDKATLKKQRCQEKSQGMNPIFQFDQQFTMGLNYTKKR